MKITISSLISLPFLVAAVSGANLRSLGSTSDSDELPCQATCDANILAQEVACMASCELMCFLNVPGCNNCRDICRSPRADCNADCLSKGEGDKCPDGTVGQYPNCSVGQVIVRRGDEEQEERCPDGTVGDFPMCIPNDMELLAHYDYQSAIEELEHDLARAQRLLNTATERPIGAGRKLQQCGTGCQLCQTTCDAKLMIPEVACLASCELVCLFPGSACNSCRNTCRAPRQVCRDACLIVPI